MDGGYGYFMSNNVAKEITSSVLANNKSLYNDYQANSNLANGVANGRASVQH